MDFQRDSFMFNVVRRGHHHPHRSVKAGASLNFRSLSHRFESVEGIFFAAIRASAGNTRTAASGAWSLFKRFSTCGGDHICIQQTGLAATSWSSRQRARHTRSDMECLFLRAVSLAGEQPKNHEGQLLRTSLLSVCCTNFKKHL